MNQGIYKLVYSKVLNMYVPASEAVRNRGSKNSRSVRKHAKSALIFTVIASFTFVGSALADTTLPAGLSIQKMVNTQVISSDANNINFKQLAPKAIVDYSSLNLAKGQNFNVDMLSTYSMLNRVHDLNPSTLNGNVNGAGNIYFINANGIIFGKDARFNVGSLYAGSLDITDDLFNSGFVHQDIDNEPTFQGIAGFVKIEQGAEINAIAGGKVFLFAPTVTNNGIINTPDGQTILAAGNKVYLASSKDPAGFLVEVDAGGTATNLGKIVAERGNITMMGLAVNQSGTLSATTSVRANGSIRLVAEDSKFANNGSVTLAKGSVTEVTPEYADKEETIASQPFTTSNVKIEASLVNIDGKVNVKGGNVNVNAENTASSQLTTYLGLDGQPINPNALENRIYLGNNAVIDVSGVDAVAPMSRNQLTIQLFSDQLKDAPILRDSGLFKETVYVDARKGTSLFDIQPFLNLKAATVSEKMTKAGSVNLKTPNEVIADKGSLVNVSGGSTTYEAGTIKETNLFLNGKLVPISEAKSGVKYDQTADVYSVHSSKWGTTQSWDLSGGGTQGWGKVTTGQTASQLKSVTIGANIEGYFEGDDAGTLNISHPQKDTAIKNLLLSGTLLANTQVSQQQLANGTAPKGGTLIASANDLVISKHANALVNGFTFGQSLNGDFKSSMGTDFLAQGFNNITLANVKTLKVNDEMLLNPNGTLTLGGVVTDDVQVNANIIAPGSNIVLGGEAGTVADGVTISTAGTYVNNKSGVPGQYSQPTAIKAGSISAGVLTLGKNVTLNASAGASVDSKGTLSQGEAGDITFTSPTSIDDSVTLQAYGFKKGGKLDITFGYSGQEKALNVAGNQNASDKDIDISNDFFNHGGFSSYALSAFDVNIGGGKSAPQEIYGASKTWQMNSGYANQSGAQAMTQLVTPVMQSEVTRSPVSLSFTAKNTNPTQTAGVLTLAENTTIRTDRGGNVTLSAGKQVNVLGDIDTPSGNINIKINDKTTDGTYAYDPTQAIYIGEKAKLSATGTSVTMPDSQPNLLKTKIYNAGTIKVDAPKGAVIVKEGAVLDVSGTSVENDTKTVTGYVRETLHGDAGSIELTASDALLLDGTMKGAATGTGRAGTLSVGFTSTVLNGSGPLIGGSREITLTQQKQLKAQNFTVGDSLKSDTGAIYTGDGTEVLHAQISAEQIKQGGFANLTVNSTLAGSVQSNSIQLDDKLDLKLAGNLQLSTPLINVKNDGTAKLSASHITLKSSATAVDNASITSGNGRLETQSKQMYIDGLVAIAGAKETAITTSQDISGQGTQVKNTGNAATQGGIVASGDLNLTARQIYPATNAKLGFEAVGDGRKITVNSNGEAPKPVLSAGGTLSLKADNILQKGVLSAPFGNIFVDAKTLATFATNSISSVSANGLVIPYGTTITGGEVFNPNGVSSEVLPEKGISIKSSNVDLQKDAVLDLSAGGDMFAYEWVPGIGGSKDVLAQPNTYAIIPSLGHNYAAIDPVMGSSSASVGIGQTVYLSGGPGLAAGYYTLLPARYALVPGAYLVQSNVTSTTLLPTQVAQQADGSNLTSGYFSELGTGARDANWSTFKVTDGAIFRPAAGETSKAPSQYILTSANKFFANPLKNKGQDIDLPMDVAKLSLDANKLTLDANVVATKQTGGSGLQVDVSSSNIRVVSTAGADDGSLQLTTSSINALNADSLLLGGQRKKQGNAVEISTATENVTIENDDQHVINMPELIVTATNQINVKAGANVDTGAATKTPVKTEITTSGDGALLALSSKSDFAYNRTGGSASSATGALIVEANSQLKAGNSVVLDATKQASLNSNITLENGGSATFGANSILIGNAPLNTAGLNLNAAALTALGQLKSLTLNSYNNIDTFGAVQFGNNKLDLTMNAAGIAGHLAKGETLASIGASPVSSVITAKNFTFKNTNGAAFVTPTDDSGRGLEINAGTAEVKVGNVVTQEKIVGTVNFVGVGSDDTTINGGKTEVAGYTRLAIKADEIHVADKGASTFNVDTITLTIGRIVGETAADFKLKADKLEVANLTGASTTGAAGVGAKLDVVAKEITVAGDIAMTSGTLNLTSDNSLNIASGAHLSAASTPIAFYNQTQHANAGSITLTSNNGNVNIDAGALVDVTSQGNADAGTVSLVATSGTANVVGDLRGNASGTGKGGKLNVDVKTLNDITLTNSKAVGFDESRQYRVRTGNVAITGTGTSALAAREIIVSADSGKITVTGEVVATANKNSHIGLFANNGVSLESSAELKANSTAANQEGGKVEIQTQTGSLDLKAGSKIDVSGGTNGAGGKVALRAPRLGDNAVAATSLASEIKGARSTVLEAFKNYTGVTTLTTGSNTGATLGFSTVADDINNFMLNKDSVVASLGKTNDVTFHLRAGTDIESTGNLTVANDWNLYSSARTGDESSVLTLRAKGNINVNGSLSDGFTTATSAGAIGEGNSSSYRIVAGADFTSANLLATTASAKDSSGNALTGNVALASNKLIRTGTGDIEIAAGGDLKMGNASSVIYTAGHSAASLDGFDSPTSALKPLYLADGGDVSIKVSGNIQGAEPTTSRQLINQWLFRQGGGTANKDTSWWVRPDLFKQSLATFGGGDVNIQSGGNISNFSASAVTTARFDTNGTTGNQVINGGGDVSVNAAGDINNGVYFVAKGDGEVKAGGSIKKLGDTFGTTLALQDGSFKVNAGKSAYIETTINPTMVNQSTTNTTIADKTGNNAYFNTYSEQSKVSVSSLTGDVTYGGANLLSKVKTSTASTIADALDSLGNPAVYFSPGSLNAVSYSGNAEIGNISLLPSSTGDLKILAAKNVSLSNITMSDAAVTSLASIENPTTRSGVTTFIANPLLTHGLQLLHANDSNPVLVVAKDGDISATLGNLITLPKASTFVAGNDIKNIGINGQNNKASDITLLKAGNDIAIGSSTLSGPGDLLVQAGRNIDLTNTAADILTTGNSGSTAAAVQSNPALPSEGASITLQAGLGAGANVQGYIDQYISPTGAGPATIASDATRLAEYHAAAATAVTDYMRQITGDNTLSDAQALTQFNALGLDAKTIFVNRHLTSELIASAKDFAKAGNHNRGNSAITTLFPTLNTGDILLYASKVSTNSGGSIDLIAPGGLINVGAPGKGFKDTITNTGDIGVITEKGGAIRAVANGDFQVNQSKVITQFGSDIAIWSTTGTIDAGRGSKTATSVPERIVQTDADGNTVIEVRGVAAGSGIRAQTYDPDGLNGPKKAPKKGNVYLTGPIVNAGEAGIEAGDLLIVAPIVLNAANIQVQGTSSGVPVAATSSLAGVSAGLSPDAVNSATQAVAQSVAQSANNSFVKPTLPSIISVDVISIGN